jgi:hypothetical protein
MRWSVCTDQGGPNQLAEKGPIRVRDPADFLQHDSCAPICGLTAYPEAESLARCRDFNFRSKVSRVLGLGSAGSSKIDYF